MTGREHGDDFASTIGAGGVVGTKFVWPDPGPKFKAVTLLPAKEEHWKKWIGIYNEKMLSKGDFQNLYVYGYDLPEGLCDREGRQDVLRFFRAHFRVLERRSGVARAGSGNISRNGLCGGKGSGDDYGYGERLRGWLRSLRIICCWKWRSRECLWGATSGAEALTKMKGFIAALKALRHPKSSLSANC